MQRSSLPRTAARRSELEAESLYRAAVDAQPLVATWAVPFQAPRGERLREDGLGGESGTVGTPLRV